MRKLIKLILIIILASSIPVYADPRNDLLIKTANETCQNIDKDPNKDKPAFTQTYNLDREATNLKVHLKATCKKSDMFGKGEYVCTIVNKNTDLLLDGKPVVLKSYDYGCTKGKLGNPDDMVEGVDPLKKS